MPRATSALALAVVALASAGCGGSKPVGQKTVDAFFANTARGRAWAERFPHRPGSRPCTVVDEQAKQRVPATCSTDVSLVTPGHVVVALTESWDHGNRTRTWFVFLRGDGTIESITREGAAPG